ncbi:hypothetical protein ABK040_005535 [Willaertia magna]
MSSPSNSGGIVTSNNIMLFHHPTFTEQEIDIRDAIQQFEQNATQMLTTILSPLNLEYISHRRFSESEGTINPIYFIVVKNKDNGGLQDVVFKLMNTHQYFKCLKTNNSIHFMTLIDHYNGKNSDNKIPVPKIYSYSCDVKTSPIGLEYILMERVKGQPLSNVWDKLNRNEKESIVEQILKTSLTLRTVKTETNNNYKIGSLCDLNLKVDENNSGLDLGPVLGDFAPLGPFKNLTDMFLSHAKFTIQILNDKKEQELYFYYKRFADKFTVPLQQLISIIEKDYNENIITNYGLTHGDLNDSNIIVNWNEENHTIELTGILDWDNSSFTTITKEIDWYLYYLNKLNKDENDEENEEENEENKLTFLQTINKEYEQCEQIIKPLFEKLKLQNFPTREDYLNERKLMDILYYLPQLYFFQTSWFHNSMNELKEQFNIEKDYLVDAYNTESTLPELLKEYFNIDMN